MESDGKQSSTHPGGATMSLWQGTFETPQFNKFASHADISRRRPMATLPQTPSQCCLGSPPREISASAQPRRSQRLCAMPRWFRKNRCVDGYNSW